MFPIYRKCFQTLLYVSNILFLFPIYILCFQTQTMFPNYNVSNVCFQYTWSRFSHYFDIMTKSKGKKLLEKSSFGYFGYTCVYHFLHNRIFVTEFEIQIQKSVALGKSSVSLRLWYRYVGYVTENEIRDKSSVKEERSSESYRQSFRPTKFSIRAGLEHFVGGFWIPSLERASAKFFIFFMESIKSTA